MNIFHLLVNKSKNRLGNKEKLILLFITSQYAQKQTLAMYSMYIMMLDPLYGFWLLNHKTINRSVKKHCHKKDN